MIRKHLLAVLFLALSFGIVSPCDAQQDPETAARQAEIDAEKAKAQMRDTQRDEEAAVGIDDADAPQLRGEDQRLDEEEQDLRDAQRRESQARDAENQLND